MRHTIIYEFVCIQYHVILSSDIYRFVLLKLKKNTCSRCVFFSADKKVSLAFEKVQVGNDQEKAQSERDSHSKNRGGKKPN